MLDSMLAADQTVALTGAERRVVDLVARGYTNAEIGRALCRSPKTIEWTLTNVYRKLSVRSRTQLVAELARARVPTWP
jgi:DNA-binding CsgD family transcriptional regulator